MCTCTKQSICAQWTVLKLGVNPVLRPELVILSNSKLLME
jgi:hypothetical protein